MMKKLCIIALSFLVICSLLAMNAMVGEAWILDFKGTGQLLDVGSVKIGVDPNSGVFPYPPSPPPEYTVVLKVKATPDDLSEDVRPLGAQQEVWLITVMMGGTLIGGKADASQPGFFPVLSWDPNQIGDATLMELRMKDANGPVLADLLTENTYQTKEADISDPSVNYTPAISYALIEYAIVFEAPPIWYRDADGDTYGDPNDWIQADVAPLGYVADTGDCNDSDPDSYVGATELCDGIDNNCDGIVPSDETTDADSDGFLACNDCDDSDPSSYPGATELCDGIDNNCDGQVPVTEIDDDGDGFSECQGDCDDTDNTVYPGASELCDLKDNDCNGIVDDPNALVFNTYYADTDGDGYGDSASSVTDCKQPPGYVLDSTDCDDTDAATHPGATEICDGSDNNCDGTTPADEVDNDGDGVMVCAGDCDDADAATYPGATEICDGSDNNCDGTTPADEVDADGDGVMVCAGDCDDADAARFPGNSEICDGKDNDCDGIIPDDETDADSDGYMICQNDCDPNNPAINPGAAELCDGIDNNCNGIIDDPNDLTYDDYYRDADEDGYGDPNDSQNDCVPPEGYILTSGDCNDADPNINPAATEVCDGIDNDCNGTVDDPSVLTYQDYYRDADEDGYGDPNDSQNACSQPDGYVLDSADCDDTDADINPDAEEVYDGIDNNCDGRPDEECYFVDNLIATGQDLTGQTQTVSVEFGVDWDLAGILIDPNNWADAVVRLQLIDELADISDPNTFVDTDYLTSDIRTPSGQTEIAWYVMVEIGDAADANQPGYYPVLSWDPNDLGCSEVDGDVCVYEIIRGLGDSGTVLVANMADTNSYQTVSQDGEYLTILWSCAPPPTPTPKPPKPTGQIFPWPGVYPGALGWGGIPFSAGFPGGLPYPMKSGYAPGLSIPSFPGTYTGFTYPGSIAPWTSYAWTSYVPRFPVTFPAVGIFSPIGWQAGGWPTNYWTGGYPTSYRYQTGWFYTY